MITSIVAEPVSRIEFNVGSDFATTNLPKLIVEPAECAPFVKLDWNLDKTNTFASISAAGTVDVTTTNTGDVGLHTMNL